MIYRADALDGFEKEMFGGPGIAKFTKIVNEEGLAGKGRLFSVASLKPGCAIGSHKHSGELEIYYVMLIGLKQLDEGEELAADFKEKLQNEVDSRYLEIEKNSKRKYAVKIVIVLTIAAMLIWMFVYLVFAMFL